MIQIHIHILTISVRSKTVIEEDQIHSTNWIQLHLG